MKFAEEHDHLLGDGADGWSGQGGYTLVLGTPLSRPLPPVTDPGDRETGY